LPKNDDDEFFYYSIQTKVLRNESNLIESFKLLRILNSLKFLNYLIQIHSKVLFESLEGRRRGGLRGEKYRKIFHIFLKEYFFREWQTNAYDSYIFNIKNIITTYIKFEEFI